MKYILICILLLFATHVSASERCYQEASKYYNLPVSLLKSITKLESGGNPYALNIGGKSHFPESKTEALGLIKSADKTFDIGLMQINKWWFDRYKYDYSLGLDACWNIKMGAYILAYEISRHGYTWDAVGRYHSSTNSHKTRYINKLIKIMPQ